MPPYSDLLEFYKQDAQCHENHVVHTFYVKDPARNVRKVKVEQRWDNVKRIGHGSFGEVWLQRRQDGTERAVKKLSKYHMEHMGINYLRELEALAKFTNPRGNADLEIIIMRQEEVIVEFFGWFEAGDLVFLAMEYFQFGDLSNYISTGEIAENDAKRITKDVLEALMLMHGEGFTHRDLKPKNIFVVQKSPQWWVKLGDFGITKRIDNERTALRTYVGSPAYIAPEIQDDESPESNYTQAVDVWSLGCVVYVMLTQKHPFPAMKLKWKPFREEPLQVQSRLDAIELLRTMLVVDPSKRATAKEAISSKWVQSASALLDLTNRPIHEAPSESHISLFTNNSDIVGSSAALESSKFDAVFEGDRGQSWQRRFQETMKMGQAPDSAERQTAPLLPLKAASSPNIAPATLSREFDDLRVSSNLSIPKPVFGLSLEGLRKRDGAAIPLLIHSCIQAIDLHGLDVKGIYQSPPNSRIVNSLQSKFDFSVSDPPDLSNPEAYDFNIHNVADLLKCFLRSLVDPLLNRKYYSTFIEGARIDDNAIRRDVMHATVNSLPDESYAALRALILHLNRVREHSAVNTMTAKKLALIFGPILMGEDRSTEDEVWQIRVIDEIITYTFQIFDDV